jgi:uncharacterized protein YheU (UPF0270 family)
MTDLSPIQVPIHAIDEETLARLVEEFVTRDGTDYGLTEISTERKVTRAMAALDTGKTIVIFEPSTGTVTLVDAETFARRIK